MDKCEGCPYDCGGYAECGEAYDKADKTNEKGRETVIEEKP